MQVGNEVSGDYCFAQVSAMSVGKPFLEPDGRSPVVTKGADGRAESALEPRKAVQRLICFFSMIVVLAFVMNAIVTSGLRRIKTSSYGAWNQAMQGRVNADIIISGSSRAAYHYDPRIIEASTGLSAFNLGRNGSQTDVQLAVLKAYLEHNRKPKLIVHNLDTFSFVTSREVFDPALYVPYLRDKEIYQPLRRIDPDFRRSRYLPLYGYVVEDMNFSWVLGLKTLMGWPQREDYYLGFSPRDKKWTDDFQKFRASNQNGVSFAVEPAGVHALDQLVQVCQQNGIQLVFVYSPEYTEMQAMTNNRAEIFAHFQELANHYHVPLWDYSNWKHNGDRDYFYNSQHLNATGAAAFSSDFANRLKNYLAAQFTAVGDLQASGGATQLSVGGN
jgi:hypothetical protein